MGPSEFLRFLWGSLGGDDGAVVIWRTSDKRSVHLPAAALRQAPDPGDDDGLFELMGRENLYAHPGLRAAGMAPDGEGRPRRGRKRDVVALGAFVLDIDVASPAGAHKASNAVLPRSLDDVADILAAAPALPSLVVMSGYGYQPWWVFDRPIPCRSDGERARAERAWQEFEAPFLARAKKLGFHLDSVATLDHQFRLPGTVNAKRKGEPRDVVVVDGTHTRVSLADLGVVLRTRTRVEPSPEVEAPPVLGVPDLGDVRLAMKKLKPDHPRKAMIEAVLAGESFALRGERDSALYAVCSTIAWFTPARRPEMTPQVLAELLRPSLAVWASEPDAEKTLEEEIEKAIEKFESAFENRAEDEKKRFADGEVVRRGLKLDGQPVTEETVNGASRFYSVIQTSENDYFVWNFGKQEVPLPRTGYYGPFGQRKLFGVCKDFFSNCSEGFSLKTYEQGKDKIKSDKQILDEYGTTAIKVVGHLDLQESYFDVATRTFHRAMAPLRVTKAERDPDIEEWLALFGASQREKFFDWVAAIPKLDQANSALYVEGPKDCGKDLFASGVAQLFRTSGPCKYNRLTTSRFNTDMFACPLIWLNEGVDSTIKQSNVFIRDLVSSTSHDIEGKGVDVDKVVGAIRLYIAANNANVLSKIADEDTSEGDLPAIVQRFFHVEASPEAVAYLAAKKQDLVSWVKDDRIARHVLYLAETRTPKTDTKFLVEGESSTIHRALIHRGDRNEIVLEWLANLMEKPEKVIQVYRGQKQNPLALVGDGHVYVNTKALVDHQDIYRSKELDRKHVLLSGVAARVLSQLAGGRQKRFDWGRERYHAINPECVFEWVERTQIGDAEVMKANLARVITQREVA